EIQEESYEKYWRPMQANLGDSLTEFVRHYLMKSGTIVKQSDVYFTLKDKIGSNDALATLKDMAKFASYYHKILHPQFEAHASLQTALEELTSLDIGTAYPFLLNCYDDYQQDAMSVSIFLQIIELLENFIVRRFICNTPTSQLNKIFPILYAQAQALSPNDIFNGLKIFLQNKGYPKDAEILQRMVSDKMYGAGDRLNKAKFILKRLEQHFAHKEKVDVSNLTIEHIMPQTLSKEWQESMGQDYQTDHDLYLHVIGNLTLTAYNSELSNSSFAKKKELLKQSHLDINKYFTNCESWTKHDIEARSGYLAEIALKVWPYFGDANKTTDKKDVTGKTPKSVTILGQSFPVSSWRDVEVCSLNTLLDLEPDLFAKLQKDYPNFIGSDSLRFRNHRQLKNGLYIEMNLSAQAIYRFCTQAFESIDLSSDDWFVEFVE
ncbi:MAG TPA: HNH endonuclease family protein, partial [Agitococcus sp.]|nr:HNH endonuclease family protein [Agitococcus sp.]